MPEVQAPSSTSPERVMTVPADTLPPFRCPGCKLHTANEPQCDACQRCAPCCTCQFCEKCLARCQPCKTCKHCKTHCTCWTCTSCRLPHKGAIVRCEKCGSCNDPRQGVRTCRCWTCPKCSKEFVATHNAGIVPCEGCHKCLACCLAGECAYSHIRFFIPFKPQFHTATDILHRKFNPSGRVMSSEIEVAGTGGRNANTALVVDKWGGAIVADGSLPSGGFEINTAPAGGDHWIKQIEEITTALVKDSAFVTESCGAHLHIDARDFTHYDMRRLILVYAKVEDGIYALAKKERRASHYCQPCGPRYLGFVTTGKLPKKEKPASVAKAAILGGIYGQQTAKTKEIETQKKHKYHSSRYSALNLHSWMYRGTVECRILHGTINAEELTNWGLMWSSIVDFAYRATEAEIGKVKGSPDDVIDMICETQGLDLSGWLKKQRARFRR